MAQFDPAMRCEIQFYQETGATDSRGEPVYKRMGFNLVEYDGDPDMYLEPVNFELGPSQNPQVKKFELVKGVSPLNEVHHFDL